MESASTSTALLDCHSLPHQQFSSRLVYIGDNSKGKLNTIVTKKSTRLPPIARCDSFQKSVETNEDNISTNGSSDSNDDLSVGIDPSLRVKQLEKNLKFVKEHCQSLLKCLHNELDDLKRKNRDLQFKLIISGSLSPQSLSSTKNQELIMPIIKGNLPPEVSEHMNKLDKEVKRLRFALGETLKMNALLQNELQKLREETNEGNGALVNNNSVTSPAIQDFSETFKEIHNCEKNRKQSAFTLPRITNSSSK